jgi:hypothetical protein
MVSRSVALAHPFSLVTPLRCSKGRRPRIVSLRVLIEAVFLTSNSNSVVHQDPLPDDATHEERERAQLAASEPYLKAIINSAKRLENAANLMVLAVSLGS